MVIIKPKRWCRRNRHRNPELVDAFKVCDRRFSVDAEFNEYPYPRYSEEFGDIEVKSHLVSSPPS